MAGETLYVNKEEFARIMNKLEGLGLMAQDFDKEMENTAKSAVKKIRSDFNIRVVPHLQKRGEDTTGLSSSIRRRTLKRKKGVGSAYRITAGGVGKELMAYAEFGTRSRRINLAGITSLFGSKGQEYAKRFKGSDNPKDFTHLSSRPYFFHNIFFEKKDLMKRLGMRVNRILKKK